MDGFAPVSTTGGLVRVSGVAPSAGTLGDPIERQVADVLRRLDRTLHDAGSSLARALSIHVQVRHAADFAAMNAAYSPFFAAAPPARTTVVAPPETPGALVQIGAVAAAATASREAIRPTDWQPPPNPYSYAVRSDDIVFLSGLVPRDGRTNTVVTGDLETQMAVILDNAAHVLGSAGLSLTDVVSARVFLTDAANASATDALYLRRMSAPRPARATVVTLLMNPNYLVEMTLVAMAGRQVVPVDGEGQDHAAIQSSATAGGGHVFASNTGVADGSASVEVQARGAAARLGGTLRAAGLGWAHVIDVTLHVTEAAHAAPARRALQAAIGRPLPAGTTLVCGLVPEGALVQILATAVRP